ncbi:MAG: hypothetical protein VW935_04215, partial [Novosphingobium sp.]
MKDAGNYLGDIPLQIDPDDALSFPAIRVIQLLSGSLAPDVLESLRTSFRDRTQINPQDLAPLGIGVSYDARTLE